MKNVLSITAFIISLCFAGNCSDNPEETTRQETVKNCHIYDNEGNKKECIK